MQKTEASALYAGADLHGNNVFLSVINQKGDEVFRRRVAANLESVHTALRPYWPDIKVLGVESTFNWYWLVDGLQELGLEVRLGNPARMQQYNGLKSTNDHSDAHWLAEMLRLDVFPACYVYPQEIRGVRGALRRRQLLVRQRTQLLLSMEGLLKRYGIKKPGVYTLKQWTQRDLHATGLDHFVLLQAGTLLQAIRDSDQRVKEIETSVKAYSKPMEMFSQVKQVPGIGDILGMTIILETGALSRFANAGCYASYCRLVQSRRESNGKKKGENNRRNGNSFLSWAFIEVARFARRYEPCIQAWFDRKKRQSNSIIAHKALACKLAKATWHVMNGKDFEINMLFG